MSKQMQLGIARSVGTSAQGITGKLTENLTSKKGKSSGIDDEMISTRDNEENYVTPNDLDHDVTNNTSKKRNKASKPGKTADRTQSQAVQHESSTTSSANQDPTQNSGTEQDKPTKLDTDAWSQNQQKILEWCLTQHPKGTDERWEKIAQHIPGKSKVRGQTILRLVTTTEGKISCVHTFFFEKHPCD